MSIQLGVVMDPIESIKVYKDSSFAMMLAAQRRGWDIWYITIRDIYAKDGRSRAHMRRISVVDDHREWFRVHEEKEAALGSLDVILMRKDPPFDMEYVYSTYFLEQAESEGALIINSPDALRDANEKLFATHFPQCCAPSLVSCCPDRLRAYRDEQEDIVVKPLDAMGGSSIFRLTRNDPNTSVILEQITEHGTRTVMAQRYIPEIEAGDKRILMVDGVAVPYALARIPAQGELRGNLAAGGRGEGVALSARDRWICEQVGPNLRARGIVFAGLDVIGDYLTEINITSPTCIRELDAIYGLDIGAQFLDAVEGRLASVQGTA